MNREQFVRRVIVSFLLLFLWACAPANIASPEPSAELNTGQEEFSASGEHAIEARTADGQAITVEITVVFEIKPENLEQVRSNWPAGDYVENLIRPIVRGELRNQVAEYAARALFSGESLFELQNSIKEALTSALDAEGFTVLDVLLEQIDFSDAFIATVDSELVATLEIQNLENIQQTATQAAINLRNAEGYATERATEDAP